MGVMPNTSLLLVSNGVVQGHFDSYSGVAHHLGISVSDDGQVTFMDKKVYPTYLMEDVGPISNNHWESKELVIKDWSRSYMSKHLPAGYTIYRYLT